MVWSVETLRQMECEEQHRKELELAAEAERRQRQRDEEAQRAKEQFPLMLKPVEFAPPLRRINGFGVGLYGKLREPGLPSPYFKMYFLTALWVPVLPLGIYLVSPTDVGFRFFARARTLRFVQRYRARVLLFYLTALLEGAALIVGIAIGLFVVVGGLSWLFGS